MITPGLAESADIVASTFADDGSFGWGSYNLTGPKAATRVGYGYAVRFRLATDRPVAFSSAALALAYRGGTNRLDVVLMSDNGGTPGVALETIVLSGLSAEPSLVVANSSTHPVLYPGRTYWLAALAKDTTYLAWMANAFEETGRLAYRVDTGRGPGPWRATPSSIDPAFAIWADPVAGQ